MLRRPFTVREAADYGVGHEQLQGLKWRRVRAGTYVWAGVNDHPLLHLQAARLALPESAAFSGLTAAWLLGTDVDPLSPIEATAPPEEMVRTFSGIALHRAILHACDVTAAAGLRCTSMARTVLDLARQRTVREALVVADQALRLGLITVEELSAYSLERAGKHGAKGLRRVVELADGRSESSMETELRLLLVDGGLPPPDLQVELHDPAGGLLGRVDLLYPEARLAIEYDGAHHRLNLAEDHRRQNRIVNGGYRLLRFTFADVRGNPAGVIEQVSGALGLQNRRKRIRTRD